MPLPSADTYAAARPFPHAIIDGLWDEELLDGAVDEFPPENDWGWDRCRTDHEHRKLHRPPEVCGPRTRELLDRIAALDLAQLTGEVSLRYEPVLSGMQVVQLGGHLDIATDRPGTVKVIVFLNRVWAGGDLELWDADGPRTVVSRTFGRTVILTCTDSSWHGQPWPVRGPVCQSVTARFVTPWGQ